MNNVLDVYLHDLLVGQLSQNSSGDISFYYDNNYVVQNRPSISVSLPLSKVSYHGDIVKAFFSGLLPDDIVRHKLAKCLGISEQNTFALLEAIGGECAGALSLYPQGTTPPKQEIGDIEVLDDKKLKEILDLLKRQPLLVGQDNVRLSLAGAQDKIAISLKDGKVALVKGTTPTTHILKPLIDGVKDSVYNELFCMRLAALVGIDVPNTEVKIVNNTPYFLIERYDRVKKNGIIKRLHQEDFCQALGLLPYLKYESERGPNLKKCEELLLNYSARPAIDRVNFLNRIIFNYLIGNADAHGKNFSLIYRGVKPELAPAYDLLSTASYPGLSTRMAMKIGGEYEPNKVCLDHWYKIVPNTEFAKKNIGITLSIIAEKTLEKADFLKHNLKQIGIKSSIFNDICNIISERSKRVKY